MTKRFVLAAAGAVGLLTVAPAWTQAAEPGDADKPDLSGIWQAMNTANWDLEPHAAAPGNVPALGARWAMPPGPGIVEGGKIPYLESALARREENYKARWTADPEIKCYMPGVPRANYMPYPFQIVQGSDTILMTYEFADAVRMVYMKDPGPAPAPSWMGWSIGHWDGNTLVVDVTSQSDQTWLDRVGDYHSDAMHVVERYTPNGSNILMYQATIVDPKVFSRPWTLSMPLYRHVEKNAQLMEFKCIPFAEEVIYGQIGRGSSPSSEGGD
ncbi:MAG TPA: hypothetical protein VFY39_11710 [Gammaproteobacteria bacterium]|nr:hypothetical protein [Gammaproteobacteria bacterium]